MPSTTPKQDEALRHFLARVRDDFATIVREVRLLADRPAPKDDVHPDLGLLVAIGLPAEGSREVDHRLDNVACEVSLVDDVLLELAFSHEGEDRGALWEEPASLRIHPG